MKVVFRMCGWSVFALFTGLLCSEFCGISVCDTCIFSLGGTSVGSAHNVIDLNPIIMATIYLGVLVANIASAILKKDFVTTVIGNGVLSIPVLLVLYPYIFLYPPFAKKDSYALPIQFFLIAVYLSVILIVILGVYGIIKYRLNKIKKQV